MLPPPQPITPSLPLLHLLLLFLLFPLTSARELAWPSSPLLSSPLSESHARRPPSFALPYPNPTSLPSTVFVVSYHGRSSDDQLLLSSLQGALAQRALHSTDRRLPLLYRVLSDSTQRKADAGMDSSDDDSDWTYLDHYARHYPTVAFNRSLLTAPLADLLSAFRSQLSGAVLTATAGGDGLRIAISLAGVTPGAFVATNQHVVVLKQLALPIVRDVRGLANETAFLLSFAPFNHSPAHLLVFSPALLQQSGGLPGRVLPVRLAGDERGGDGEPHRQCAAHPGHMQTPQALLCAWLG